MSSTWFTDISQYSSFMAHPKQIFDYISAGSSSFNNYPGWLSEMINEMDVVFQSLKCPIAFADVLEKAADNRIDLKLKGLRQS